MYIKYQIIIMWVSYYIDFFFWFFFHRFPRFSHSSPHYSCPPVAKCFYKKLLLLYFIRRCFRYVYSSCGGFIFIFFFFCVYFVLELYNNTRKFTLHRLFSEKNIFYNCMHTILRISSVFSYNVWRVFVGNVSGKV